MKIVFFTSITSNYLPKAAVLADSLRKHRPESLFYVLLCDTVPAELLRFSNHFDRVLTLDELELPAPNMEQWIFKHTVVELCTAVKGLFLVQALEKFQADAVVYFDPDIVVLDSLTELEALLDAHSVIVTPHLVEPDCSLTAIWDNEVCSLKHGVFNLGFLAVCNSPEGRRFAQWWRDRLVEFCYDDIPNGLFTDQRWMDLAPCLFGNFYILRDKTYNVATWNLSHRKVEKGAQGRLCIDGSPVKFFHFSGFDSGDQLTMLKKYGQHSPALFELREWYMRELERGGQSQFGNLPWSYDFFSNGKRILREHREVYRSRQDLMKAFPEPSKAEESKLSYYRWCEQNFRNGRTPRLKLPLLQKWKRSIKKRVKFLRGETAAP
jgi:hypothetical protein